MHDGTNYIQHLQNPENTESTHSNFFSKLLYFITCTLCGKANAQNDPLIPDEINNSQQTKAVAEIADNRDRTTPPSPLPRPFLSPADNGTQSAIRSEDLNALEGIEGKRRTQPSDMPSPASSVASSRNASPGRGERLESEFAGMSHF